MSQSAAPSPIRSSEPSRFTRLIIAAVLLLIGAGFLVWLHATFREPPAVSFRPDFGLEIRDGHVFLKSTWKDDECLQNDPADRDNAKYLQATCGTVVQERDGSVTVTVPLGYAYDGADAYVDNTEYSLVPIRVFKYVMGTHDNQVSQRKTVQGANDPSAKFPMDALTQRHAGDYTANGKYWTSPDFVRRSADGKYRISRDAPISLVPLDPSAYTLTAHVLQGVDGGNDTLVCLPKGYGPPLVDDSATGIVVTVLPPDDPRCGHS